MSNLLERALHTFWEALVSAGIVVPAISDKAGWTEILIVVLGALGTAGLSALKTWLQERTT